jgi:A/G-specific adenine glycosylase
MDARTRHAFRTELIRWFQRKRRAFPWRRHRTAYRVWISELMLQQTRADAVIPYYHRFMRRFPSLRALASATRGDVLKLWEGLGYYARARNAQDTARFLVGQRGGRFPKTLEELQDLPGVGAYTAAAVASLAFGCHAAVVDGNVARVLSRVMAFRGDVRSAEGKRRLQNRAEELLLPGRAGLSNEAVMELGALCCVPRRPKCDECPLGRVCCARAEGRAGASPVRRPRKKVPHKIVGAGVVVNRRGEILIAQRLETSMLGGLWEFPGGTRERGETIPECIRRELNEELGIDTVIGARLIVVHHAYSHFTIALHAHWARVTRGRPRAIHCADFAWSRLKDMRRRPFSAADLRIIQALEKNAAGFPNIGRPAARKPRPPVTPP